MRDAIQEAISENPVILFMKGNPEAPACGFSARTVAMLQSLGTRFAAVDILPDPRIRQELSAISKWPTIPQLFVDGELVGGCDIVTEMYESGELAQTLGMEDAEPAAPVAARLGADDDRKPSVEGVLVAGARALPPSDEIARPAGAVEALRFAGDALWALDQTRLPGAEVVLELRTADEVAAAIQRLSVRGAPLIGVAAAYGVAMSAAGELESACATLLAARPTAANLAYAVQRVPRRPALAGGSALDEARAIHAEEAAASDAMARHGADLLAGTRRVLTHCNTGALAAPGRGTALAVVAALFDRGGLDLVLACETRPLLQGARLTVWELGGWGSPTS